MSCNLQFSIRIITSMDAQSNNPVSDKEQGKNYWQNYPAHKPKTSHHLAVLPLVFLVHDVENRVNEDDDKWVHKGNNHPDIHHLDVG